MKLLRKIYITHSPTGEEQEMHTLILEHCDKIGANLSVDVVGNLYVTKGTSNTYPCVVAHLDHVQRRDGRFTMRKSESSEFVYGGYVATSNPNYFERSNLGSDSKNGIWCALKLLESEEVLKCVFFVQSRIGFVGAHHCDMRFFDDVRFVLQADNSGGSSVAIRMKYCDLTSEQFLYDADPEEFDYNVRVGLVSDIHELYLRGLSVASCNISNGSHHPESVMEYCNLVELRKCLRFMEHIVRDCTRVYVIENKSPREYPEEINDELCLLNSVEF